MRSLIVLAVMLVTVPSYAQDRYKSLAMPCREFSEFGGLRGVYVSPYDTSPPRIYSGKRYLGELSHDRYAPDSISNPYGRYGSRYSLDSINNPYGPYGRYSTEPIYVYPSRR